LAEIETSVIDRHDDTKSRFSFLFEYDGWRVRVALERPASAPAPKRHAVFTVVALKHRGDFQERAVKHGAIVAGEIDQT
jgi:hypothetical protein